MTRARRTWTFLRLMSYVISLLSSQQEKSNSILGELQSLCCPHWQPRNQVFEKHISSVSSIFKRMLQVLHLDVSKVDRTLHLPSRFCYLASVFPHPPGVGWATAALSLDAGNVRDNVVMRKTARKMATDEGVWTSWTSGRRQARVTVMLLPSGP